LALGVLTALISRAAFCVGWISIVYARHGRELMGWPAFAKAMAWQEAPYTWILLMCWTY